MQMRIKVWVVIAILYAVFGSSVVAQEITGTISGAVTDDSGGAVSDAAVTVTSTRTAASHTTTTTPAGIFFFNSLPSGDYQLSVQKPGFKDYQLNSIQLHVDDKLNFPITLKVGAVAERV